MLNKYFKNVSTCETMELDDIRTLLDHDTSEASYSKIVESNLRLVISIAKRYLGKGYSLEDLIQEGNMGLMHAAKKFNPDLGYQFSTYASWWIRNQIERAIYNKKNLIRVPINTMRKYYKGKYATEEEQEEAIMHDIPSSYISLDAHVGNNESYSLIADILNTGAASHDDMLCEKELLETLTQVIEQLPEKKKFIVKYRFGFVDGIEHSLKETGDMLGISSEAVRQNEMSVITILRSKLRHLAS